MLITSLFYSKLFYGSEVCHLPERTVAKNKMLKCASANALRIITNEITIFHTHTQIHNMTRRALPDQMMKYKHALLMYKLFRQCTRWDIIYDPFPGSYKYDPLHPSPEQLTCFWFFLYSNTFALHTPVVGWRFPVTAHIWDSLYLLMVINTKTPARHLSMTSIPPSVLLLTC